jgi:acetyltransferase-like isoleucine patch superfamily enzyme
MRGTLIAHNREQKGVMIEEDVTLGAGVIVLPAVTIGRGAIVTAGSDTAACALGTDTDIAVI